ncbi:MAG: ACP S-malonyltransferase [Oscillospiraceae bacterium]|nr:ACP S-malonyltransferase [Oscillospiraceae bacterium]
MDTGKIAFMFSGQGAQYTGMGRELYDNSEAARAVFDLAERIRPGTIEQCFSGSEEELTITENTQPCVFCVDLAAAVMLDFAGVKADMVAGFSLGELPALAYSGAFSYEDAFELVWKRGIFMDRATQGADSGMAAILRLSNEDVEKICKEFKNLSAANYNCPGQVVIAGLKNDFDSIKEKVSEAGGRFMPLKTSGAFHSPFMLAASTDFALELANYDISDPRIPTYSNVTAKAYDGDIKVLLAKQISSSVKWENTVRDMISAGAKTFIEVGPGKTLCGLVQRISDEVSVYNVEDYDSFNKTLMELGVGANGNLPAM